MAVTVDIEFGRHTKYRFWLTRSHVVSEMKRIIETALENVGFDGFFSVKAHAIKNGGKSLISGGSGLKPIKARENSVVVFVGTHNNSGKLRCSIVCRPDAPAEEIFRRLLKEKHNSIMV